MNSPTAEQKRQYKRDIVTWAESEHGFYVKRVWIRDAGTWRQETKRPIVLRDYQKRLLRHITKRDDLGRMRYETVVWSEPKKSGKTAIAALLHEWFSYFVDVPGEQYVIGNDLEGAKSRVYKALKYSLEAKGMSVNQYDVTLSNGTEIKAIASDYRGEAGAEPTLVSIDEPWGIMHESQERLQEEFTNTPTRPVSLQLYTGYAGWTGESDFWEREKDRHDDAEPIETLADIGDGDGEPACRVNGRTFSFWSHTPRQPWQTQEYYTEQRRKLRPGGYIRMHENRFTQNESRFVAASDWQACESGDVRALRVGNTRSLSHEGGPKLTFGADASTSRDSTALIGVWTHPEAGTVDVCYVKVWTPTAGQVRGGKPTVDLSQTIGKTIYELYRAGHVAAVYFDPYQLHSIAVDLERAGVKMVELPQTSARTAADQALYDAIIGRTIRHYGHPTLSEHVKNAVAVESPRGFRIAKEKTSQKVDACVALSMAHYGVDDVPTVGSWDDVSGLGDDKQIAREINNRWGDMGTTTPLYADETNSLNWR